ncbi:MAG: hypothetical protein ABIT20_18240 [Gemmatimonadaceae bacterium]
MLDLLAVQDAATGPNVHWLTAALWAGAVVDVGGAIGFLFFAERTERAFQLPREMTFWPQYASVFLVVLALLYAVTARHPELLLPNVGVAIVGRALGGAFYLRRAAMTPGLQWPIAVMGATNALFAFAYITILGTSGLRMLWRTI